MRTTATLPLLTTLLCAPTVLGAQGSPAFEAPRTLALDGASAFGTSAVGDFTGDGRSDVVVIVDDRATLLFGPDAYRGSPVGTPPDTLPGALAAPIEDGAQGPEDVWDLAVFENTGPASVDALFTVGESGLVRWRLSGGSWERTVIGGGWVAAGSELAAVSTWEYADTGFTWVGVLEDDGQTVHVLIFLRSTGNFFTQTGAFTLNSAPITSFELVNLDSDAQPEILAVSADGIDVWNLDGSNPIGIDTQDGAVFATTLDEPQGEIDRLAFVVDSSAGVLVYALNGLIPEPPVQLANSTGVDVHGLASGDFDGDGYDDLLISSSAAERFTIFRNGRESTSATTTFSSGDTATLLDPADAANELPSPVKELILSDVEDDGDADALLWDAAAGRGLHLRSSSIPASDFHPLRSADVGDEQGGTFPVQLTVTGIEGGVLPAEVTHVEAIAWSVAAGGELLIADDAVLEPLGSETFGVVLELNLPTPLESGDYFWSLELRFVTDTPGEPRRAWPARLETLDLEVTWPPPPPPPLRGEPMEGGVPTLRGDFLPLTDLPPFKEDEVPLIPMDGN